MNALISINHDPHTLPADIVSMFLSGRCASTLGAYRTDMEDFARFLGAPDSNEAAQTFLGNGPGHGNRAALAYRNSMQGRGLSPASINRKLATLRSLTKLARMLGLITWALEVESVKHQQYRDTRGPQQSGFKRILRQAEHRSDAKGIRDRAIVLLLHDVALRRGELVSLDLQDVDIHNRTIAVKGKGKSEKSLLSLPDRTFEALMAWIRVRGNEPGPLFINFHSSDKFSGSRLTATSVYRIIQQFGTDTEQRVTPHGLRHTAITTAVERAQAEGIDLSKVLPFSRHAKLATLQIYCDRHADWQGRIAGMVAQ